MKHQFGLLSAAIILSACQPAQSLTQDVQRLCTDTVNAYAHARDAGDLDRARDLFTEDATVTIFGNTQNGREEILAALAKRANGAVSRHIIGSVLITATSIHTATGESYVMVVASEDTAAAPEPLSAKSLLAVGKYEDTFYVKNGSCQIATRNVVIDFQQP